MVSTLGRTAGALMLAGGAVLSHSAGAVVVTLPKYNVNVAEVSVSGISSGGYMAAQMHFAYSKTIRKGAGIIAGGPVYCSQGSVTIATGPCMADTGSRNLSYLISTINTWSGNGYIDPTSNLSTSKVYLFSGTIDSTVKQPVMNDLKTMYANYVPAANVTYKNNIAAEHALATDDYGNDCSVNASPYINDCNFDTAGEILKWIYGTLNAKNAGTLGGSFVNFNQRSFWGNGDPTNHGMANDGWAYVPANCAAGQACKLHVVFHGCKQNVATVGTQFYQRTGYNRWADTNNMIILYPQANATFANPNGCWDWWGYDDVNFPAKSGGQMVAVKTMIDRVVSGSASAPYTCAQWFGSNVEHVYYGRAYAYAGNVYATNSNQYLGYYSTAAYTDVRRTSAGYYAYGKCP
ncbi:PHB depolymerase family esterase [Noviherbaspirillum sp. CPCC 100848]|uniref:PHB depolymerase family esterase n=1 Tax=Noviherbaspirillum album TaxID=3080276 RepID=A0ABU6J9R9_9BURK|nr:PHB depolymerase family esterase [Noviherbaspirillum sp. CPCC 100848]MEC4720268.1 PHB depolymerase family esterase [Noviherbaspirillum sp. CPCC 100848]